MATFILGYFLIGLLFIVWHFFYHILPRRNLYENLTQAVKNDFIKVYSYFKQTILSNVKIFKIASVMMIILIVLQLLHQQMKILNIFEAIISLTMFFLLVIVFVPQEDSADKGFPVEIFGFIYSSIFMFYSAGWLVVEIFNTNEALEQNMWIFGYIITIISYVICISTLRRFMDRDLSREGIVLLGMIILTTLEFITYYGVGFFGGMAWHNRNDLELDFDSNLFGDITKIISQGIFISAQTQILGKSAMEIWGFIILNGTDVLTITAVLGYLMQKFIESKDTKKADK